MEDDDKKQKNTEEDLSLPKTTIDRIILTYNGNRKCYPRETKNFIAHCALNFVHMLTGQANEICEKEKKKTLTHYHVFAALKDLGFDKYLDECNDVYKEQIKKAGKKPSKINKFKESGLTLAQLEEQQKKLFESAKKAYEDKVDVDEN